MAEAAEPPELPKNLTITFQAGSSTSPLCQLIQKLYPPKRATVSLDGAPPSSLPELPTFSYEHESRLLCEPFIGGRGVMSRACLLGDSCIGKHKQIPCFNLTPHGGIILTEFFNPEELNEFHTSGTLPSTRRCCILCHRYNVHSAYLSSRKQTTFPSDLLLNCFVNPAGPNEYDSSFVIPSPDIREWHGIYGTCCGLFLNTLMFEQNPVSGKWFINQERMRFDQTKANNIAGNTMTDSLYRAPVDPRVFLYDFFQLRTRVTDSFILFGDFAEVNGTSTAQRIKIPHIESKYMTIAEDMTKSFIHKLVHYRVNRLNVMINECSAIYGDKWCFMMQLFLDAHIPMMILMEKGQKITTFALKYPAWEQTIADLLPYTSRAAVNGGISAGMTAAEKKKMQTGSVYLLIQLLVKALPEFCQTKVLHEMFVRGLGNKDINRPLFGIIQCFMLGHFTSNKNRHTFRMRKQCIAEFTPENAKNFFQNLDADEHISLYIMRQYLLVALPTCPPLAQLVDQMSPIQRQASKMNETIKSIFLAGSGGWRNMIRAETLEHIKKLHKRTPKRKLIPRGCLDSSLDLLANTKKSLTQRGLKRTMGVAFEPQFFTETVKRLRASPTDCPSGLAESAAKASELIVAELNTNPMKRSPVVMDEAVINSGELARLSDFGFALDFVQTTTLVELPVGLLDQMKAAIVRRFECDPDDWDTIRRVSRVTFCSCCGFRNFILTSEEMTRKTNFIRAAGRKKLALDLNTGIYTCVEKKFCHKYGLIDVDLLAVSPRGGLGGGMLVLRNETITVSPCCGHLCRSSTVVMTHLGWTCPCCALEKREKELNIQDPRICAHCTKRSALKIAMENKILLRDDKGRVIAYGFCRQHYRTWAKPANGYLTFDFVTKNITNRSGNGLVLNPI